MCALSLQSGREIDPSTNRTVAVQLPPFFSTAWMPAGTEQPDGALGAPCVGRKSLGWSKSTIVTHVHDEYRFTLVSVEVSTTLAFPVYHFLHGHISEHGELSCDSYAPKPFASPWRVTDSPSCITAWGNWLLLRHDSGEEMACKHMRWTALNVVTSCCLTATLPIEQHSAQSAYAKLQQQIDAL
uniref:Uncharacterized protein n=1 Tax=Calcidiscus leptoporus TaxID=127549 RepID=A0A7S0IXI9_9EUKA